MAKVDLANLAPRAINQAGKRFVIRDTLNGPVAQAWPTPGKRQWTERERQYQRRFAFAASMASNPTPLEYQTAVFLSKGTDQVPRDVLTMAALGTYYILETEDGFTWPQGYGPLAYQRPEKGNTMWEWSLGDSAWTTPQTPNANKWKGNSFQPPYADVIYGVRLIFTTVNGAQYKVAWCTLNGSNQITALEISNPVIAVGSALQVMEFAFEFALAAGVRNCLMVSRTDLPGAYSLPIRYHTAPLWHFPFTVCGSAQTSQATLAVGQTITSISSLSTAPIGLLMMQ